MKGVTCFLKVPKRNPSIGFHLGYTYRRASHLFANALKPYDITPEQWLVLYHIGEHEGLNQKEVAAKADKDQPTTTRILDLLEKKDILANPYRSTTGELSSSFDGYRQRIDRGNHNHRKSMRKPVNRRH